jgi:hypothetical protein
LSAQAYSPSCARRRLPWHEKTWDTPDVAHDNPADQRFHASLVLGFTDPAARAAFFDGGDIDQLSQALVPVASAIHGYEVSAAVTYVKNGKLLPPLWLRVEPRCLPTFAVLGRGHRFPRSGRRASAAARSEARRGCSG